MTIIAIKDAACFICYEKASVDSVSKPGLYHFNPDPDPSKKGEGTLVFPCGHLMCVHCIHEWDASHDSAQRVTKCFLCSHPIQEVPDCSPEVVYRLYLRSSIKTEAEFEMPFLLTQYLIAGVAFLALSVTNYARVPTNTIPSFLGSLFGCLTGSVLLQRVVNRATASKIALIAFLVLHGSAAMSLMRTKDTASGAALGTLLSGCFILTVPLPWLILMRFGETLRSGYNRCDGIHRFQAWRKITPLLRKNFIEHQRQNTLHCVGRGPVLPEPISNIEKAYQRGYFRLTPAMNNVAIRVSAAVCTMGIGEFTGMFYSTLLPAYNEEISLLTRIWSVSVILLGAGYRELKANEFARHACAMIAAERALKQIAPEDNPEPLSDIVLPD